MKKAIRQFICGLFGHKFITIAIVNESKEVVSHKKCNNCGKIIS